MVLHETGVAYSIVRGRCSHTTVAFLQRDGQNEPGVDAGGAGNRENSVMNIVDLIIRVVRNAELRTSVLHDLLVVVEHGVKT